MEIEGSSALVVGGASGLGEATVRALAERGADVVIADLNAEKGNELASELGDVAEFVEANVLEEDSIQAAVEKAAGASGGLRISVCCAGIGWAEKTASAKRGPHNLEYFSNVVKVNLIGTFNVLRLASAAMLDNEPLGEERGICVNTASIAGYDGQIGQVAYASSKGGIIGMTLPAARDLANVGIRVATIAPGTFDTPLLAALPEDAREALGAQTPFPNRLGAPAEYASLATHIIDNPMINGETVRLDGALRMPPK